MAEVVQRSNKGKIMVHRVLEKTGKKVILLGNEAIARGALEAGVGFASCYPGTPSSEIGDTFSAIARGAGIYFEYSSNEKVAVEAAAGAAWCGVRSIVSMKHFGFNVASDSIFPIVYHGARAGMVIVVADDPGCWSSGQSEQDTRWNARLGHMPMFEPASPKECRDFTKLAFELSEKFNVPFLIRLTTRVSHASSGIKLDKVIKGKVKGKFDKKDGRKWRTMPPQLLGVHEELHKKLELIRKFGEKSRINFVISGRGPLGVVTSGVSFNYVMETLNRLNIKLPVLKLSLTWPLPVEKIKSFIKGLKTVLVVEELEDLVEKEILTLAKGTNPKLKVHGKDLLPVAGEFRPETVEQAICKLTGNGSDLLLHLKKFKRLKIPKRLPVLCPGCPHRASFWASKKAAGEGTVFGGDIGCYILGIHPPLETQDFVVSMGAVAGVTHGIKKVSDQKAIAFIGDSTFFHGGIPGMINTVFNKSNPLIIVLDNRVTAMTGHQPHPGTGITGMGEAAKEVRIDEIARAAGIENVAVVSPFNLKEMEAKVKEFLAKKTPSLIVSRGECRLLTMRKLMHAGKKVQPFEIDQSKCKRCGTCLYQFGCPAIHRKGSRGEFYIDPYMCWGCSVCAQICPFGAIKPAGGKG